MVAKSGPTFCKATPTHRTLPIVKQKVNVIMNLNINISKGVGWGGIFCLLLKSGRNLMLMP